ncbi:pilus assembly protein TadG-related protein [Streptomyces sp. NBC_01408]|uniref:pilus assembly protein TadG-related protein n=1 Tax=Streptomyces sp. NBC_01408 TaxID=2903855 RepID=UPI0022524BB5|nr:pilus assembly protein TadG-related protein [Streptomyces sp. NBC_01408]MCX4691296.1 pilus assembly protein TadG-related protein [Streptomyces sp. NBC_01408]
MTASRLGDRGQAFPIYIVVVAGLLFAALAFFVVGQASTVRSDAQGAADAAALAAARDARDHLVPGVDLLTLKPEEWKKVLEGAFLDDDGACDAAHDFATRNAATAQCDPALPRFTVEVTTTRTVGDSVVPGVSGQQGTADATAVIEPRCQLGVVEPSPAPSPSPTPSSSPLPGGEAKPPSVEFKCKGGDVIKFDPAKPETWSSLARTLFAVRLVD